VNVPRTVGAILSHGMATLHELSTIYSISDMYDMLEVIFIDAVNQQTVNKREA
jgi:hypothetical protein